MTTRTHSAPRRRGVRVNRLRVAFLGLLRGPRRRLRHPRRRHRLRHRRLLRERKKERKRVRCYTDSRRRAFLRLRDLRPRVRSYNVFAGLPMTNYRNWENYSNFQNFLKYLMSHKAFHEWRLHAGTCNLSERFQKHNYIRYFQG